MHATLNTGTLTCEILHVHGQARHIICLYDASTMRRMLERAPLLMTCTAPHLLYIVQLVFESIPKLPIPI